MAGLRILLSFTVRLHRMLQLTAILMLFVQVIAPLGHTVYIAHRVLKYNQYAVLWLYNVL